MEDIKDLSADELLAAGEVKISSVVLRGHGRVYLRPPTGAQRDDWEGEQLALREAGQAAGKKAAELHNFRARFLARCICNKAGELLYRPDQADALAAMDARVLDVIYTAARKLAYITEEDEKALLGN